MIAVTMKRTLLVAIGLAMGYHSANAGTAGLCKALFAGPEVTSSISARPLSRSAKLFVESAEWLSKNVKSIDPKKTHLGALAPLILDIVRKVEAGLPEKTRERLYAKHEPLLRAVLAEALERIQSQTLTYEFVAALPFRLGFLLTMRGTPLYEGPEPPSAFESTNYAKHELFMKMAEEASSYHLVSGIRKSTIGKIWSAIQEFPVAPLLPASGNISFRTLNIMSSRDVWVIGVVTKPVFVDGVHMSEFLFTVHDLGHRSTMMPPDYLDISLPMYMGRNPVRTIDRLIMDRIEASKVTDHDFKILHFLHFYAFHEHTLADFRFMTPSYESTEVRSRETLKNGLLRHVDQRVERSLSVSASELESRRGLIDINREFESLLNGVETRQEAIARVFPVYRQIAIDVAESIQLP